mmetsp:Transcript_26786/g.37994  ORF Transcript_26786/g.37994 Transcript_26786/m.37994 type:complete len:87 (-) Transcript_26786:8-268(-)
MESQNHSEHTDHGDTEVVLKETSQTEGEADKINMDLIIPLLRRNCFDAGGSARFMFDYSIDQLIEQVFEKIHSRMRPENLTSFAQL